MELLKETFGMDALEHAFGEDGKGMQEIEENAAIASLEQCLRKQNSKEK